tara:strand:+ start:23289 stop:24701 length:1413 start_codon:yes stop_codon:yes gene_type:complete
MLRKAIYTRYAVSFLGILFTVSSIFFVTFYLDVYEFAVWGIANSLIYFLTQIGQLTYVQYVEKYFPNLEHSEMFSKLIKFIKTVILFLPIWFLILIFLDNLNYFEKYKIENIEILFLLISLSIFIESTNEIISKYVLSIEKTIKYDQIDFILNKFLKLIFFLILLINHYSIYHLLFTNLIIKFFYISIVIVQNGQSLSSIISEFIKAKVFKDNFLSLSYSSAAFLIKTLHVSFLNIVFLIFTPFVSSSEIATFSLCIFIINNLRPVSSSISALLIPKISRNIQLKNKDTKLLNFTTNLSALIGSGFVLASMVLFLLRDFYVLYFDDYLDNFYYLIVLSIFASTINSLYAPKFFHIKFSNEEGKILIFTLINYFSLVALNTFFEGSLNIILIYIIFELINFLIVQSLYYLRKYEGNKIINSPAYIFAAVATSLIYFEIYLNIQILILILLSILLKGIVSISKEYKKYLDIN